MIPRHAEESFIQTFNYTDSDFMKEAGMAVDTSRPMTITGEVIKAPSIRYGNGAMVSHCIDESCGDSH